ncbi:MAG: hypothetical protein ABIH50_02640 [bacterium]
MKKYQPIDLSKIKTYSVKDRPTKVDLFSFAKTGYAGASFKDFYDSLPSFLGANDLKAAAKAIIAAHKNGRPVIIGLGAHVIKVGLSPLIIDLMKKGIVSAIALNGAGAIHDFEIATLGRTSEEVGEGLETGMFGMVEETMQGVNEAIMQNEKLKMKNEGMGRLIGNYLLNKKAPNNSLSLLANAAELDIPLTVHVAIGTDTVHMSPHVDAKALGEATYTDFRLFCSVISDLEGGFYLNLGSAVLLPEVFLKALTVARNLGNKVKNFTTINMDMIQHYRPRQNVLARPGGKAFSLTGHHEIMVPLLYQSIIEGF